jgi:hypothetical protein
MQLFSKNPAKALEAARANHAKLTQRLTEAQSMVDARRSAAKDLARNGAADSELDKAEAQLRAAVDRVDTLTAALAETAAEIKVHEADEAAAADKAQRESIATEVEQDAVTLAKAARQYLDGAAALAKITAKVSSYVPEFAGLNVVCNAAVIETPPLLEFGGLFMASYAEGKRSGAFPTATPAPQPAPMALVLSTKSIAWRDIDGTLRTEPRLSAVTLPIATADRAVKIGAAVRPGHDLWKQNGLGPIAKPKLSECVDLDNPDLPINAAPLQPATVKPPTGKVVPLQQQPLPPDVHSAFEKPTIGPPRQMSVARNDTDLIARNNRDKQP